MFFETEIRPVKPGRFTISYAELNRTDETYVIIRAVYIITSQRIVDPITYHTTAINPVLLRHHDGIYEIPIAGFPYVLRKSPASGVLNVEVPATSLIVEYVQTMVQPAPHTHDTTITVARRMDRKSHTTNEYEYTIHKSLDIDKLLQSVTILGTNVQRIRAFIHGPDDGDLKLMHDIPASLARFKAQSSDNVVLDLDLVQAYGHVLTFGPDGVCLGALSRARKQVRIDAVFHEAAAATMAIGPLILITFTVPSAPMYV